MKRVTAFLLAVAPIVLAQAFSLHAVFVVVVAAVGIAAALLTLVPRSSNRPTFILLIATFTAGISISLPVLEIGRHHPISTGSLMAQSLLWLPTAIAVLIARPSSPMSLRTGPQRWLALLFILGMLLAPFSTNPVATVTATVSLLAVTFVATAAHDRLGATDSFRAIALGIAGFVLTSMIFAHPGTEWNWAIGEIRQTTWGISRISGFAAEPMHLSLLAGLGTIMALSTVRRASTSLRYALIGAIAINSLGALWGQGRMPLVAIAVSALWFLLRSGNTKTRVTLVSFTAAALAIVILMGPGDLLRRDGSNENLSSLNGRDAIWPVAIDAIQARPLLGYGAAGSERAFTDAIEDGSLRVAEVRNAHNRILEIWITFGLLGLVLITVASGESLLGLSRGGAPEAEGVLIYLLVSGLTTPGSGSAFVDPLILGFVVALIGLAANSSDYRTLTPGRTQSEGPVLPSRSVRP